METPIKLALVDDQNLFREGMKLILSSFADLDVIMEADSGIQLLEMLKDYTPDVILLDYTMPEMDGYETLQKVNKSYPNIKVIMLTMHYDERLMAFMMQNGANGYLLKDESSTVVREAIKIVMKEGQYFPQYVSKAILKELQHQSERKSRVKTPNPNQPEFSQREKEILALIGIHNRQEISEKLFISIKTVDFHLKNLRDKTSSASTAELVRFALQNGFQ